ncbi:MAG: DUF2214 family protein [Arcobacteraceae bacterium]
MYEIIIRYFHFTGIIFLSSILVFEHLFLKYSFSKDNLTKLISLNNILLISFFIVIASGLFLWIYVGKPYEFYSQNWIFHIKGSLVVLLFILFIANSIKLKKSNQIKTIVKILNMQLVLLLFIILCAVFMAKGIGYYGI